MEYSKGNIESGLTPITSPWMNNLFNEGALLTDLLDKYGSPINIHQLQSFSTNISIFKEALDNLDLSYQIYYARKANKCTSLVKRAFKDKIGVDTASFKELQQCIQLGGNSENIVLTSAIKTSDQIELAIKHQIPIILDNWDEILLTIKTARKLGKKANIGLRISGFTVAGEKLYSRFGFDIDGIRDLIFKDLKELEAEDAFDINGLHFHLDGYSTSQRGKALSDSLELAEDLAQQNIHIKFIDIGGGITMNYLKDEDEWNSFQHKLKDAVLHNNDTNTFSNNGLGFENIDGELKGKLNTYPFFNKVNGVTFLEEVLHFKNDANLSNASRLRSQNIQFRMEPGRSLLNQVGMTVAKVVHRKRDAKGQWLVGLDMNMSQMMSSSADFLLDPFVIFKEEVSGPEVDLFFTGAYCLERDVLLKRKITLPNLPAIDDIVIFVNTAGYMMHFFETEAHLFDLSTNLSISKDSSLKLRDFEEDAM